MLLLIPLIIFSCCCNVILLEILIRYDSGCGNVITFFQFLAVAVEGFVFTTNWGSRKPVVPIKNYVFLVVLFFSVSVANNYALNFNIPMPLHMIFKSGSLVANMILGMIILKRRYSMSKYVSVFMVSIGIFIATLASEKNQVSGIQEETNKLSHHTKSLVSNSVIGIFLLTSALIVSAGLGIYQEMLYKKYGKHPREVLFYSHALPLPGFLLLSRNIYFHSTLFSASEPFIGNIPKMWIFLFGNVVTQYVCVRSVFTASTYYSSLTVTMIITLRKFISLLFSIFYFKNPFTAMHWLGTFLVFSGTLLFAEILTLMQQKIKKEK